MSVDLGSHRGRRCDRSRTENHPLHAESARDAWDTGLVQSTPSDAVTATPGSGRRSRDTGRAPTARRTRRTRWAAMLITVALLGAAVFYGLGYQLFYRDHQDTLRHADAIVVLGGEHDGREDYGLQLAEQGYADTVLISNPYDTPHNPDGGALMKRVCSAGTDRIEVICFAPDPSTTRGEAMEVRRLAAQRGWQSVIVVSWRYHLVRARDIFGQCFDGATVMRGVPREYPSSPLFWTYQFAYQYAGLAKAAVLGC